MARNSLLAAFVLSLCLSRMASADEPAASPPATTEQIHQTVDRAIPYLQAESANWLSTRGCAACHHAGMPFWARRSGTAGLCDRQEIPGR